jgi:hypothetical protein
MLLSFEIPTKHLAEFIPLEDFQFGLAHLFLKKDYPGWEEYHKMYQGCLLDNSMYELGYPLPIEELMKAAALAKPRAIIAPDWMDEYGKTMEAAYELWRAKPQGASWSIGVVVQGKNYEERRKFFLMARTNKWSPICFPFRSPREETMKLLARAGEFHTNHWYHMLGLRDWIELSIPYPGLWSIDTSKPFKGYKITEQPCRGQGGIKMHDEMSFTARRVAGWNIAFMRQLAQYGERQRFYNMKGHKSCR